MTSKTETRPVLPQNFTMQTYSFAPPNLGLGDNKKSKASFRARVILEADQTPDYVFVDEHNRHKRLKGEKQRISDMASGC